MTFFADIQAQAVKRPQNPALLGISDQPLLNFEALVAQIAHLRTDLRAAGIHPGDRIALVLENGPEVAAAFLAISAACACAPLNPAYSLTEYRRYLEDLDAAALVIRPAAAPHAISAALSLGLPIIELRTGNRAGEIFLKLPQFGPSCPTMDPTPADLALILHTSGTTSAPKKVGLSHANLRHSAGTIRRSLALTPEDRCINIMPLFHIHGLMAALLGSLTAGASVICTPSLGHFEFNAVALRSEASWYTAVPTLHDLILSQVTDLDHDQRHRFRLVRSSSAPLQEHTALALAEQFEAQVVQAYGMTEASHQIAATPLHGPRPPGSIGQPTGTEMTILDPESDTILGPGLPGELALRGVSVISNYLDNPQANRAGFSQGWFRTGDLGCQNAQGNYFITGRLKEMINRGGEKIAPTAVEQALLSLDGIKAAAAFSLPDALLGETVAAILVAAQFPIPDAILRQQLKPLLASFKIPRNYFWRQDLPLGSTGKLQRTRLAALVMDQAGTKVPPISSTNGSLGSEARIILAIWEAVLNKPALAADRAFLDQGGHSIAATRIALRVRTEFGLDIPMNALYEAGTVLEQAKIVKHTASTVLKAGDSDPDRQGGSMAPRFVELAPGDDLGRPLLVWLASFHGNLASVSAVASHLPASYQQLALLVPGIHSGERPQRDMLRLADQVRAALANSGHDLPLILIGICFGAWLGNAVAAAAQTEVNSVRGLIQIDPYLPPLIHNYNPLYRLSRILAYVRFNPHQLLERLAYRLPERLHRRLPKSIKAEFKTEAQREIFNAHKTAKDAYLPIRATSPLFRIWTDEYLRYVRNRLPVEL